MKHLIVLLLACCVCLAVPPALSQEDDSADATEETKPAQKPKRKSYKGTIESIDLEARVIKVAKIASSKTFTIAANAHIKTVEKEYATLADLREGDLINLRFVAEGETNTVSRITRPGPAQGTASPE